MRDPRFTDKDLRVSGGGCYLRRDAHTNPSVKPPFFLNDTGKWYLNRISLRDEADKPVSELRGLYCTNCHNALAHEQALLDMESFLLSIKTAGIFQESL